MPHPRNHLSHTDIRRLKLVQTQGDEGGSGVEAPHNTRADLGHALLGQVVDDDVLEAEVGVDDDEGAEDGVHDRVERPGGEGGHGQGHQAEADGALKGPVVGAVGGRSRGDADGLVNCWSGDSRVSSFCWVVSGIRLEGWVGRTSAFDLFCETVSF